MVREGRAADSGALAGLLSQLGHEVDPVWLEGWLRHVERLCDRVLVAELSGEPVGVAVLHLAPFLHECRYRLRLTALVVDRSVRSLGIGALLLDACEAVAREMGCQSLELTTREERRDAHRFYEREGMRITAHHFERGLDTSG